MLDAALQGMRWSYATALRLVLVGVLASLALPVDPQPLIAAPSACHGAEVRYRTAGRLRLDHTPLNAGNGTYRVGPGIVTLRFAGRRPGAGPVQMLGYRLSTNYSFTVSVVGMRTTVVVHAIASATPDSSGVVASGRVEDGVLHWSTPISGYRTYGTVICSGAMCGRFGLPPPGTTRFSDGPAAVHFKPFAFRLGDLRRFTMESTELPPLRRLGARAAIALAGWERGRHCSARR